MKSKKELKEQYKQTKPVAAIFQIKNKTNGKILIDESLNVTSKWNRHRTELRFGSHRNKILQKDWNELGEENFTFSILSELVIKEGDNVNLNGELKLLRQMVESDNDMSDDMKY
jgi:hypothetical protein